MIETMGIILLFSKEKFKQGRLSFLYDQTTTNEDEMFPEYYMDSDFKMFKSSIINIVSYIRNIYYFLQ